MKNSLTAYFVPRLTYGFQEMDFCTDQMLKESFEEAAGCISPQVVRCKLFAESCGISFTIMFTSHYGRGGLKQQYRWRGKTLPIVFFLFVSSNNYIPTLRWLVIHAATLDSRSNKDVFQSNGIPTHLLGSSTWIFHRYLILTYCTKPLTPSPKYLFSSIYYIVSMTALLSTQSPSQ